MRSLRALLFRIRGLFRNPAADREFDDEMAAHLEMQIADNLRSGMTEEEARRRALISTGGLESAREAYRDRQSLPLLDSLFQDLRYAGRMMTKNPGFTAVVALTLALGIGVNTAVFSVVDAALTPLPIPQPDRAVMVWTECPKRDWHHFPASIPDYEDWKASGVFSSLAMFGEDGFNLRIGNRTERVNGLRLTPDAFAVFATRPLLGRVFEPRDAHQGNDNVVILTESFWRSRFGADPSVVGKNVMLDGVPHIVAGVVPKPRFAHEDLYVPLVFLPPASTDRGSRSNVVVGRLRPGLTLESAQHRMKDISERLAREYPKADAGLSASLQPLEEALFQDAQTLVYVLLGAVGFVLLIACANIANLLMARSASRGKEMAIRAALGAGRGRIGRQLLVENMALALLGGVIAVVPAFWAIQFILSFHLDELPNTELVSLNSKVLIFNFALAAVTGILFGFAPLAQLRKTNVNDTLKQSSRNASGGVQQRLRGLFVISEIALTLVLLTAAGLILQSFLKFRAADPGYRASGVITMRVALSGPQYASSQRQLQFFNSAVERARALPGVVAAAATEELPSSDNFHASGFHIPERPATRVEDIPIALHDAATIDYFQTARIPLLRGRYFTTADREGAPAVAIIDDWTARRYWPNQDVVGKHFKMDSRQYEIVGVVGNVEPTILLAILKGRAAQVYVPVAQEPKPAMTLVVRAAGDPASLVAPIEAALRNIDADQPVFHIQTMEQARVADRAMQLLATSLLGGFAILAMLLATIGIYGVVSYSAGQRTREFGIRISLGARPSDVVALALRQGIVIMAVGIAIGLACAFALTRALSSLLYGLGATDPWTFAFTTALLAAVGLLASYIPARRQTKVDPLQALRHD